MPAVYAHLQYGNEVAKSLPPILGALIEKYPEAFALGTQGPDILFYHEPLKKNALRSKGSALHKVSGNRFFSEQAEKLLKLGNSLAEIIERDGGAYASYVCGFLCHFTLDVSCHPYVNEKTSEEVSHFKIESEFDKFLLKQDDLPIRGYNTAAPILDQNGVKEAVAYSLDVPVKSAAKAIKTMRTINKLFSYPFEPFHSLAQFVLGVAKLTRTFGDMFLAKKDEPLCEESNHVLNELLFSAVPKGVKLIEAFFGNLEKFKTSGKLENDLLRYDFSGNLTEE